MGRKIKGGKKENETSLGIGRHEGGLFVEVDEIASHKEKCY